MEKEQLDRIESKLDVLLSQISVQVTRQIQSHQKLMDIWKEQNGKIEESRIP